MQTEQPVTGPTVLKHSGFGIISFVISLLVWLADSGAIILVWILIKTMGDKVDKTGLIGEGLLPVIFLGFLGNILGLIFGMVGAAYKQRRKIFPVLGIVFNGLSGFVVLAGWISWFTWLGKLVIHSVSNG